MLCTASTVKDTLANTRFFVAANLASGVDHMFVFLDHPGDPEQQEIGRELEGHPHVTCIGTDKDWWRGSRPSRLNVRQRINANWVIALLEPFDWARWVFHIDGDEVISLDREVLAEVPEQVGAVWLTPLEAVSQARPPERPTRFKRLLSAEELNLLAVLGVLDQPSNQDYFHGHVLGKSGVRPAAGLRLTLHEAVHPSGQRVRERHADPRLRVLHYDAVSGEEFVRKWRAIVAAGSVSLRPDRAPLAMALRGLVDARLSPEVAERYLARIYERTTEDDVTTLSELGLLEQADPTTGSHVPAAVPDAARGPLAARLDQLREQPKRPFHVNHAASPGSRQPPPGVLQRVKRRVNR
jgi:hypothetical protein